MEAAFVVVAGLMGIGGIILMAASAHAAPGTGLDSAGSMLLFHASALLGGLAVVAQGFVWRPLGWVALAAFALGSALFSGDIAMRAFAGHRLFPLAAPAGGTILIAGWISLALAAAGALGRGN